MILERDINFMKLKTSYVCNECASIFSKWSGQCSNCGAWNTIYEEVNRPQTRFNNYANARSSITPIDAVTVDKELRLDCGLEELNRVLGGGVVEGSVVLVGGDPGIGKSTLLLQTMSNLSTQYKVLYVTGEESLQQVAMRARRLNLPVSGLRLLAETNIELILSHIQQDKPKAVVIDSIQTIYSDEISSAPGGVSQVRESTAKLVSFAKSNNIAIFLVGHVTKDGALAGPRVLEHMVDSVLYFEGQSDSRFRAIRAIKNRFGAVNELGIFAMTDKGLKEVTNPSAIFLSGQTEQVAGSIIMATWEGTRPLLVEVQALVDKSYSSPSRRLASGFEQNRLAILLAVLHKHGRIGTYDCDVFINVVGGVKVSETASDLAIIAAVVSSLHNKVLARDTIIFGEVGLAGEIRPVQSGQERLREAQKHGFTKAIIPKGNNPKIALDIEVVLVQTVQDVLRLIL